jgi:peptidoglycan/LPS O-acetylase OafA/YrhL
MLEYLAGPWTDPNRKRSADGASLFALDGVRGLAVLIVIASHTAAFGMAGQGSIGVLLFFMLSGFVLSLPFVDQPARILSVDAVRSFYVNRTLRIVPVFVVAVLYLSWVLGQDWSWVQDNVTFAKGWTHLWSVAEEARFYVLFPFVVAALAALPNRASRIVALAAMIWAAWRLQYHHKIDMMIGTFVEFYFWYFLAGVLACFLYRPLSTMRTPSNVQRVGGAAAVLIVAFLFTSSYDAITYIWRPLMPWLPEGFAMNGWYLPVLWCALLGTLLLCVTLFPASLIGRWMRSWPMRHVGLLSYSLYLFHVPVIMALEPWGLQGVRLFVATFAITYAVAIVTYLAIEKPALMLKSKGPLVRRHDDPVGAVAPEPRPLSIGGGQDDCTSRATRETDSV